MFGPRDLALRAAAAALSARAGYALTRRLTPLIGGEKRRWIADAVAARALPFLEDADLARAAGDRFVAEIACDDLDAITSLTWRRTSRDRATEIRGEHHLRQTGPLVLTSFHFSGGFRVFDALAAHGRTATFLHAPPRQPTNAYASVVQGARMRSLRRGEMPPFVAPGPGARDTLNSRLGEGGAVVALLDVAPSTLELRDHVACSLLDRPLRLPIGLLRLAAHHRAAVIPYAGWIEKDRRVLEFHEPVAGAGPEQLLNGVLSTCERIIRTRPWTWQAWPEIESFFDGPPG